MRSILLKKETYRHLPCVSFSSHSIVTLVLGVEPTEQLKKELIHKVRSEIGAIATPDKLQFANSLPKTRSGKIMRRILRK